MSFDQAINVKFVKRISGKEPVLHHRSPNRDVRKEKSDIFSNLLRGIGGGDGKGIGRTDMERRGHRIERNFFTNFWTLNQSGKPFVCPIILEPRSELGASEVINRKLVKHVVVELKRALVIEDANCMVTSKNLAAHLQSAELG